MQLLSTHEARHGEKMSKATDHYGISHTNQPELLRSELFPNRNLKRCTTRLSKVTLVLLKTLPRPAIKRYAVTFEVVFTRA